MDNINLLHSIATDGFFSLELLAFLVTGLYLILAISAYPSSPGRLVKARIVALKRGSFHPTFRHSYHSPQQSEVQSQIQIGFKLATVVGVGSILSPARTWLRQGSKER